MPKALGGANDDYMNPEMLFAAGYSACFDSALNLIIKQTKIKTGETAVTVKVSMGQFENGGFGLAVELHFEHSRSFYRGSTIFERGSASGVPLF